MKKIFSVLSLTLMVSLCFFVCGIKVTAMENADETLSTINGGTCSTRADGRCKIIVIGRNKCGRTVKTLQNIAQSSWIGKEPIDIVFIDCDGNDDAASQLNELNGKINSPYITYCYYEWTSLHKYYSYIADKDKDSDGYFSLPVVAYINADNSVVTVSTGTKTSDDIYFNLMGKYPAKASEESNSAVTQANSYYSNTTIEFDEEYEEFEIEEELIDEFEEEEYCSDISECSVLGLKEKYYYPNIPDFEKDISVKDRYGNYLRKNIDYEIDYDFITGCGKFRIIISAKGIWCGQIERSIYVLSPKVNIITAKKNKSYTKVLFSDPECSNITGYQLKVTLKNGSVKTLNIKNKSTYSTVIKTKIPIYKTVTTYRTVDEGEIKRVPKISQTIIGYSEDSINAKYFNINISSDNIASLKIRPYFLSDGKRIYSTYSSTYKMN